MTDIRLDFGEDLLSDISVEKNDLALDGGLKGAVAMSLFLDRRAEDGDVIPEGVTGRGGWWGDAVPFVEGDKIGSKMWLLHREKISGSTLRRAEQYAKESLAWLIDDGVASSVDVVASVSDRGWMVLGISVQRPGQSAIVRYKFDGAWSDI